MSRPGNRINIAVQMNFQVLYKKPNRFSISPHNFHKSTIFFSSQYQLRISAFQERLQNFENRLLSSSCLSVRTEQLGSHCKDFHEIWFLNIFKKKCVEKVQMSLKSDKNNTYFTLRKLYIYTNISPNSSQNYKCSRQTLYRK